MKARARWTDVDGVEFPAAKGVGEPRDVDGDDPPRELDPAVSFNFTSMFITPCIGCLYDWQGNTRF